MKNWDKYLSVMEQSAIKTDDMATEDAYFMATHMPFSHLEVYEGGKTDSTPKFMDEDEIFENLVCNPNNEHRMIIVRGDNGTGKSHLIRYLKARMENSPSTIYNPKTEQLVFLRRLNNSVRGVFSQLIDQKCIANPEIEDKLRKFVNSSESRDEISFKTDIFYSYVAAVSNDRSEKYYKTIICQDIANYLTDPNVKEYLMREGGAISKCYQVITSPSNHILQNTLVFTENDFKDRKLIRTVAKNGNPSAQDFASTLKAEPELEIPKLVNYLNHLTREVIQRCADISSESTKAVFEQLRRDLKKQGKNLTLFIEDFTGFTGIDSELITVLSTEHGGQYSDLCRVTSIIGITNDYYDQFRDNFKDRVTHQISVTDRAYGTDDFLVQMAGRYLNAIYCDPDELHEWYNAGADIQDIPVSDFEPPCHWQSVKLGDKDVTIYPFNSKSLIKLYNCLPIKSPRTFLKEVLRSQLKEYFDGKLYEDEGSHFPQNPGLIQMEKSQHSSAIDRLAQFSNEEKSRLKSILALWGDGTATVLQKADGTITYGGIPKEFFDDLGLSKFNGIGAIESEFTSSNSYRNNSGEEKPDDVISRPTPITPKPKPLPIKSDRKQKDYQRWKNDITGWFEQNKVLQYHPDYRKWIKNFLCGSSKSVGAIPWQDYGVPAYIVSERLSDLGTFYIEGQDTEDTGNKALVYVDRSPESRDALFALLEFEYTGGWDFEGSVYYQQKLITWLERRKNNIITNIMHSDSYETRLPTLKWCLTLQYLKALILGQQPDESTPITLLSSLLSQSNKAENTIKRETTDWNDLIRFVSGKSTQFDAAQKMLMLSSKTVMGSIQGAENTNTSSLFRSEELFTSVDELKRCGWDIEASLKSMVIPKNDMLYNSASLLSELYPRIYKVVESERFQILCVKQKLETYSGKLDIESLTNMLSKIQDLFSKFSKEGIIGYSELIAKYEKHPIDTANTIMDLVTSTENAMSMDPVQQLSEFSSNALHDLTVFLQDFQNIESVAQEKETFYIRKASGLGHSNFSEDLYQNTLSHLEESSSLLENMEV